MRVVAISDTHNHAVADVPSGDVLIHSGDFSNRGSLTEVRNFCAWFGQLPHAHKLLVPGNHELSLAGEDAYTNAMHRHGFLTRGASSSVCEEARRLVDSIPRCRMLIDEGVSIEGTSFYGSPWMPAYGPWVFGLPRNGEALRNVWEKIPRFLDVLITHTPPYGFGDKCSEFGHIGCEHLLRAVHEKRPRFHVFGHNHAGAGVTSNGVTTFVNAAVCDEAYEPTNPARVFNV